MADKDRTDLRLINELEPAILRLFRTMLTAIMNENDTEAVSAIREATPEQRKAISSVLGEFAGES